MYTIAGIHEFNLYNTEFWYLNLTTYESPPTPDETTWSIILEGEEKGKMGRSFLISKHVTYGGPRHQQVSDRFQTPRFGGDTVVIYLSILLLLLSRLY